MLAKMVLAPLRIIGGRIVKNVMGISLFVLSLAFLATPALADPVITGTLTATGTYSNSWKTTTGVNMYQLKVSLVYKGSFSGCPGCSVHVVIDSANANATYPVPNRGTISGTSWSASVPTAGVFSVPASVCSGKLPGIRVTGTLGASQFSATASLWPETAVSAVAVSAKAATNAITFNCPRVFEPKPR
jgi:hypothetical protein